MQKKLSTLGLLFVLMLLFASVAQAKTPRGEVLGLRIGMSRDETHRRLQKMGRMEREERKRQEVWTLEGDTRFSSALIGYDADFKVRYVTAIAREGGRRMRYNDVASIKSARAENAPGSYRYIWDVKPKAKRPGYFVIVQGRDPEYLTSLSIKTHN